MTTDHDPAFGSTPEQTHLLFNAAISGQGFNLSERTAARSLPNVTEQLASYTLTTCLLVGHHTLIGCEDGNAHTT